MAWHGMLAESNYRKGRVGQGLQDSHIAWSQHGSRTALMASLLQMAQRSLIGISGIELPGTETESLESHRRESLPPGKAARQNGPAYLMSAACSGVMAVDAMMRVRCWRAGPRVGRGRNGANVETFAWTLKDHVVEESRLPQ